MPPPGFAADQKQREVRVSQGRLSWLLVDRRKGTLEERKVGRGDTSTFQMRTALFPSFSGGSDDLSTAISIHHSTEAEVGLPTFPMKHMNLIFPFCEIKSNICLQLCNIVLQVCGKANNHTRELSLAAGSQIQIFLRQLSIT